MHFPIFLFFIKTNDAIVIAISVYADAKLVMIFIIAVSGSDLKFNITFL